MGKGISNASRQGRNMTRSLLTALLLLMLSESFVFCAQLREVDIGELRLHVPEDIQIHIFAEDVPKARHMAFDDQGILFLSQHRAGKVVALPDANGDGKSDATVTLLKNRRIPHGLAFAQLDSGYFMWRRRTRSCG